MATVGILGVLGCTNGCGGLFVGDLFSPSHLLLYGADFPNDMCFNGAEGHRRSPSYELCLLHHHSLAMVVFMC